MKADHFKGCSNFTCIVYTTVFEKTFLLKCDLSIEKLHSPHYITSITLKWAHLYNYNFIEEMECSIKPRNSPMSPISLVSLTNLLTTFLTLFHGFVSYVFLKIYLLICLCQVLVEACRAFSCSMQHVDFWAEACGI